MNLVIDIGNTQTKVAFFNEENLVALKIFDQKINNSSLKQFRVKYQKINSAILCSVKKDSSEIRNFLAQNFYFIEVNEHTKIPLKNLYKTPKTLGNDRLANAIGANHLFPDKNLLVIDMGTCIKYDFVNSENEYLGGAISPGIDMRFKALNQFTAKLPLIKKSKMKTLIGQSTRESILSGVQNGIIAEISNITHQYKNQYQNVKIILTGGDAQFIHSLISEKNCIFAAPNLTLIGLNAILNFNHVAPKK